MKTKDIIERLEWAINNPDDFYASLFNQTGIEVPLGQQKQMDNLNEALRNLRELRSTFDREIWRIPCDDVGVAFYEHEFNIKPGLFKHILRLVEQSV